MEDGEKEEEDRSYFNQKNGAQKKPEPLELQRLHFRSIVSRLIQAFLCTLLLKCRDLLLHISNYITYVQIRVKQASQHTRHEHGTLYGTWQSHDSLSGLSQKTRLVPVQQENADPH